MNWKEFFRPTKVKIITSIIISIVLEAWIILRNNSTSRFVCEMICDTSSYPVLISGSCKCPSLQALISDTIFLLALFVIIFSVVYTIYSFFTRKKM